MKEIYIIRDEEYLAHHGIKGQKWGVRRYQNEDGSLTDEGKQRYNIKKDSNGVSYGTAKTKEDIERLSGYMTAEGLICNSDQDRKLLLDYLKSKNVNTKNLGVITIKGSDMNKAFKLTGENAYQNDLQLQVFTGLDNSEAYNSLSSLGSRWMEDIIADNKANNIKHSDYLEHHGVKGQRWGIRRYQNEDGSLTDEGKQRYGVDKSGNMSAEGSKLYKKDIRRDKGTTEVSPTTKTIAVSAALVAAGSTFVARKLKTGKFISDKYGYSKGHRGIQILKDVGKATAIALAAGGLANMTVNSVNSLSQRVEKNKQYKINKEALK